MGMSFYVYYVYMPAPKVPEVSMESVVSWECVPEQVGNGTNQLWCHITASLQTSETQKTQKCMLCVPFVAVLSMYTVGGCKCVSVEKGNKKSKTEPQSTRQLWGEHLCTSKNLRDS